MASENDLAELLPFLSNPRPDVRAMALNGMLPFTVQGAAGRTLLLEKAVLTQLRYIAQKDMPTTQHDAVKALINLTNDVVAQREVGGDADFLKHAVVTILSPQSLLADPYAMLLSNLTKLDIICAALLKLRLSEAHPSAVASLADVFVKGDNAAYNKNASFHFLASVLANLSISPAGRAALLARNSDAPPAEACPLARMAVFTEHPDTIRRGGVASCIKNCCFDKEAHADILGTDRYNILPRILLPLCGPEEFDVDDLDSLPEECQLLPPDKRREPDERIRLYLVEALLLLCTTPSGRAELRRRNIYRVVQMLHTVEADSEVREAVERLVQFLKRDEGEEKIEEVDEDEVVQEV